MAHDLNTIEGQVTMAHRDLNPWHRLGFNVGDQKLSPGEMLSAAHLDNWQVELEPMFVTLYDWEGNPFDVAVPDRSAVIRKRDNVVLGTVGSSYVVQQNEVVADLMTDACNEFGVYPVTAGALGNGSTLWMQFQMPQSIQVGPDTINGLFALMWDHAGLHGITGRPTLQVVVCRNTLNAMLSSSKTTLFNVRHTVSSTDRLIEAKKLVTDMTKALYESGENYNRLADRQMDQEEIISYIRAVVPAEDEAKVAKQTSDKRAILWELFHNGAGAAERGSTAWTAYNAVTEYVDHVWPYGPSKPATQNLRLENALFGSGDALKLKALAEARKLLVTV